jgi:hypothetical protein
MMEAVRTSETSVYFNETTGIRLEELRKTMKNSTRSPGLKIEPGTS